MKMQMKTLALSAAFAAIPSLMLASASEAALITFAGSQNNIDSIANDGSTTGWRSTGNAKPLDIDGTNDLGTDGWIRALQGGSRGNPPRALPTYIVPFVGTFATSDATSRLTDFANTATGSPLFDAPATGVTTANPATEAAGDAWHSNNANATDLFQFTIQNANLLAGETLRVGFLFDASNIAATGGTQIFTLRQTVGGIASAVSTAISYAQDGLDVAFFDLRNLVNGDKFVINVDANGTTNARSHLLGITWDSAALAIAVPEPATATLGLLAAGGLMLRRRRMA